MRSSYSVLKYTEINGCEVITHPPIENHIKKKKIAEEIRHKKDDKDDEYIKKCDLIIEEAKHTAETLVKNSENKAKDILEKAEEEGNRIKAALKDEGYQEGYQKGQQEGYQKGYQEGYQHGIDEANNEAEEIRKSAEECLKSSKSAVDEYIKSSHDEIVKLALNIARQVINSEISVNPELISKIAEKVLSNATDKTQIILKVNPEDFDTMKEKKESLSKYVDNSNNLFIVADYNIPRGSIKAETPSGFIDGSIDTQMDTIIKNLLEM